MEFLKKKLSEKSTYAGLGIITALIGLRFSAQNFEIIGTAILGIIAAIEVFRPEN